MKTKYFLIKSSMIIFSLMLMISFANGQGLHVLQGGTNNASQTGGLAWIGNNTSTYLSFDNNEIQARDGASASTLFANYWGGSIDLLGALNTTGNLNIDGIGMVYINSSNRLGIGTGAPDKRLTVNVSGNDGLSIIGNDTGDAQVKLSNGGGNHFLYDDDSNGHALGIESAPGRAMKFNTNGANERMRIESGGDVGIGVSNPTAKLEVAGTVKLSGRVDVDNTGTKSFRMLNSGSLTGEWRQIGTTMQMINYSDGLMQFWPNGSVKPLELTSTSGGIARLPLLTRIGGNTDGSAWTLGVNGQSIFRGPESNGTTTGGINIVSGGQSMWLDGNEIDVEVDQLALNFNSNQSIVLRNTDTRTEVNVGHGLGSPGGGQGFTIENQSTNNNYWSVYVENGSGDMLLYENGSFRGRFAEATGAYSFSSDRRLKKDIVNMESVLDKVMRTQPKNYIYKADKTNKIHKGFIAQDLELLFPEVVNNGENGDDSDNIYTVDYASISSIAIQAIKEQQVIIDDLKAQLEGEKSKTNNIQAQLDQIKSQLDALVKD